MYKRTGKAVPEGSESKRTAIDKRKRDGSGLGENPIIKKWQPDPGVAESQLSAILLASGRYDGVKDNVLKYLTPQQKRRLDHASGPLYRFKNHYEHNKLVPWRGDVERFWNTPGESKDTGGADHTKVPDWSLDDILDHITGLKAFGPEAPHGTTRKQAAVIAQVKRAIEKENNPAYAQRRVLETLYRTPPTVRWFKWGEYASFEHQALLFEPLLPQLSTMAISEVLDMKTFFKVEIFFYGTPQTNKYNPNYPPWGTDKSHNDWYVENSQDFKDDPGFGRLIKPRPDVTAPDQLIEPTTKNLEALRLRLFYTAKPCRYKYDSDIRISLVEDLILQVLIPDGVSLNLKTFNPHAHVHTRVVDAAI